MPNKKIFIFGIDSMDARLVEQYRDDMPNLTSLIELKSKSVFPPDSDTAWASIYTGTNPAKHGIVNFVNPIEKSYKIIHSEGDSEPLKGNTFWDVAGNHGKKVCVLFPHLAYPPWEVNGFMVSRSRITGEPATSSENFDEYLNNAILPPIGIQRRNASHRKHMISAYKNLLFWERNYFSTMYKKQKWDLFFCYSSVLDAIQHFFWDDKVPKTNICSNQEIRTFYILYDQIIGDVLSAVDTDTDVMIVSDHGHGSRPSLNINMNIILNNSGYIVENKKINNTIDTKVKDYVTKVVIKFDLGWLASYVFKKSPSTKNYFARQDSINPIGSKAFVTDLSGIKSYSYGGIQINREGLSDFQYEQLRNDIMSLLNELLGDKIEWILKKENLYQGLYLNKYPDILIRLKDGYGLGNKIKGKIVTKAHTSEFVPGSHRGESPIFYIKTNNIINKNNIDLTDVYYTVLKILDVPIEERTDSDGSSIIS
jgi:predicted AlkP superfamily phosphohydrolase/phosphomutase